MNRSLRVAGIVVATLVAALLAAQVAVAFYIGGVVHERLSLQASQLAALSPDFKVVAQHFERGLFRSTHEVTLQLGCLPATQSGAAQPLLLQWRSEVTQGPRPGARGFRVVSIDTLVSTPAAWRAQVEALIGKQAPLRVHSEVSFLGDLRSELTLPGVKWADPAQGSVTSKPVVMRVLGDARSDTNEAGSYVIELLPSELTMRGPDGSTLVLALGRVLAELALHRRVDPKLWLRATELSGFVDTLVLRGSAVSADGSALPAWRATADGIKLGATSTLTQGIFTSTYSLTSKGKVNELLLDKVELAGALRRVEARAYQRVLGALFGTTLSCAPGAPDNASLQAVLSAIQQELAALLLHNPEYSLDTLAVELGDQRAELSYSVGTQGITAQDFKTPVLLLLAQKGYLRAKVQAHKALVERVANKVANYDAKPGQDTPMEKTTAVLDDLITHFARRGYLQRSGEQLRATAAWEAGGLVVNGKPMGLPNLSEPLVP